MTSKILIKALINKYREDYAIIKEHLVKLGSEADSNEYALLATEALTITICMNDLADILLKLSEVNADTIVFSDE
jgi:hypothetical protein